jgi:predicted Fe-Mo cluster-binding NifX family protein
MNRVALPIFKMRVSPVFDSCTRLLLVDIEKGHEIDRKELYLNRFTLTERVTILKKAGVGAVICGGISDVLKSMLLKAGIDLIGDISGEIEQVLKAHRTGRLNDAQFLMPGARRNLKRNRLNEKG